MLFSTKQITASSATDINSSSTSERHTRYDVLDGMRGIAAISVMVHHFDPTCYFIWLPNSGLAVDVFFLLSGFVIAHSYSDRLKHNMTGWDFIKRRFIRLYPMVLLGLIIGTPILYLMTKAGLSDYSKRAIVTSLFYNALLLPYINTGTIHNFRDDATPGPLFPADDPIWSLFFELIASLSFLILYKLKRITLLHLSICFYGALLLNGSVLAFSAYHQGIDIGGGWGALNFLEGFPRVFFGFTFGVFLNSFGGDARYDGLRRYVGKYSGSSYVIYAALTGVFVIPTDSYGVYPLVAVGVLSPFLVMSGSMIKCRNRLEMGLARFLGWISYPLYCLHFPIGRAVFVMTDKSASPHALPIFLSIVISLGMAVILAKLYDEPVRAYLSRRV